MQISTLDRNEGAKRGAIEEGSQKNSTTFVVLEGQSAALGLKCLGENCQANNYAGKERKIRLC